MHMFLFFLVFDYLIIGWLKTDKSGTDEEPVLGFALHPSITFVDAESESKMIPTASTCINQLRLLRPFVGLKLLEKSKPSNLYDYAFTNDYFGQV